MDSKKRLFPMICLLLITAGCTTIEITEKDAFDSHRTVTPETFQFENYQFHSITIETSDEEMLDGWFLEHKEAAGTVVYFGGNGFLMVKSRPLIEAYQNIPVNLLLFDYRGYGLSSGTPSVAGVREDAIAAYRFASDRAPDLQEAVFLHGHSMGSFLSAFLADEQNGMRGYVLESPVTNTERWTRTLVPWIVRPFVRFDIADPVKAQNNLDRIARIHLPMLIIGGSSDEVTPFRMAEELYSASSSSSKRLVEIAGGSHNNLPEYQLYRQSLIEFYTGLLDL